MQKYYPPEHKVSKFNCIHCGVYSAQHWQRLYYQDVLNRLSTVAEMDYCICEHCKLWSYWYEGRMIVPMAAPVALAHADMPSACLSDYNEARSVVAESPRAACALIRLALQKLMIELGEKGKNLNDDIASLVAKGLPAVVQQALDFCRVIGNNAVHPGEIVINDNPEIAFRLFEMINFIVDDRISRPKGIKALYEKLPESARAAIDTRDGRKP